MLKLENLTISAKEQDILSGINLELSKGKAVGLTGHSGSGKTTVLKCLMGILPEQCEISGGQILLDGTRIDSLSCRRRRQMNGTVFGFVPQNPMTAFDSRLTIGRQLFETFRIKSGLNPKAAQMQIKDCFSLLNLREADRILESYPSELSGGMLQRIVAASLLIMQPAYILADEPTSALDEENRRSLLKVLNRQKANSGVLLVSHDIEALAELCDYIYVLEKGSMIEEGPADRVLEAPEQPWTQSFVSAGKYQKVEQWQWKEL